MVQNACLRHECYSIVADFVCPWFWFIVFLSKMHCLVISEGYWEMRKEKETKQREQASLWTWPHQDCIPGKLFRWKSPCPSCLICFQSLLLKRTGAWVFCCCCCSKMQDHSTPLLVFSSSRASGGDRLHIVPRLRQRDLEVTSPTLTIPPGEFEKLLSPVKAWDAF